MKTCTLAAGRRGRVAFTLIELLIVISIIAVLAVIAIPVMGKIFLHAKRTSAKNDCVQLMNAIGNFHSAYNGHPVVSGTAGEGPFRADRDLLDILMNERSNPATVEVNTRGVSYVSPKIADGPKGHGFVLGTRVWNDPWGKPYEVYMDTDEDGFVLLPGGYAERLGDAPLPKRAFVHSAGPDRDFDTVTDNVTPF